MKKKYFLLFSFVFSGLAFSFGQNCPASIGNQSTTSIPHFKIDSGTCNDYPDTITIDGKTFSKTSCNGTNLKYTVVPPDTPLSSPDTFSADFGFGICSYVNGQLQTLSNPDVVVFAPSIHPNPLTTERYVTLNFQKPVNAMIAVYDLTGKMVLKHPVNRAETTALDLSGYMNGIYLLQINSESFSVTKKLIIQR